MVLCNDIIVLVESRNLYRMVSSVLLIFRLPNNLGRYHKVGRRDELTTSLFHYMKFKLERGKMELFN